MSGHAVVVLMVEDEVLVRLHVADMIADAGFELLEASNAADAMRILSGRDDIKALVTDVHMPGSMDGLELARTVSLRSPSIGIIVMSGMAKPSADELPDGSIFMPKPVDEQALVRALGALVS